MRKTVLTRLAVGGAAAAVLVSVALAQPAVAATDVTTVPFGPSAVRFDYTLDEGAVLTGTSPVATSLTQPTGCVAPARDFSKLYTTATFSVSVSGVYHLADARRGGIFLPAPYQGAGVSVDDGFAAIYPGALTSADLDASCVVATDDTRRPALLQAGTTYTIALASLGNYVPPGSSFSMFLHGPGDILVGGLTAERAREACEPGAPVPAGYTLLEGSAKFETLVGTEGKDLIRGLGGNDTIRGLGGDDILCGGEGQDTIVGGEGNDFVFGEASQDVLSGGVGDDHLDGGVGNDVLNGNDGADELVGGEGQDTLYGQAGDDELFGNAGNDVLDGGPGTDVGTDTDPRSVFRNLETVNGPAPVTPAAR